jgi:FkbM family methyltransferase
MRHCAVAVKLANRTVTGFRKAARPSVHRIRRWRRELRLKLRPRRAWNAEHHPAIRRFTPWSGNADGRFVYDFLGVRTDPRFRPYYRAQPAGLVTTAPPEPAQAYLELAFVLDSALAAPGPTATIMELGAGHGVWLVKASRALALSSGLRARLIGVEMEPQRFEWMRQHLRDNDLDPDQHQLLHAAVSDHDQEASFTSTPEARADYGLRLTRGLNLRSRVITRSAAGADPDEMRVGCVRLSSLLRACDRVDLLHMDIQGEELRVVREAGRLLEQRVARIVIGTHSLVAHLRLSARFRLSGWRAVYDFRGQGLRSTPFGDIDFVDGLLAFVNPRLIANARGAQLSSPRDRASASAET